MGTWMTHTLSACWGMSVSMTPIGRPRPAYGAARETIPGLPAPTRRRETATPCGFHDY